MQYFFRELLIILLLFGGAAWQSICSAEEAPEPRMSWPMDVSPDPEWQQQADRLSVPRETRNVEKSK